MWALILLNNDVTAAAIDVLPHIITKLDDVISLLCASVFLLAVLCGMYLAFIFLKGV